ATKENFTSVWESNPSKAAWKSIPYERTGLPSMREGHGIRLGALPPLRLEGSRSMGRGGRRGSWHKQVSHDQTSALDRMDSLEPFNYGFDQFGRLAFTFEVLKP